MQCFTISDNSRKNAATTTAHSKHLIELLKEKILTSSLSEIWENSDGFAEQYRCVLALYFTSVMSQCYSVIINHGISEPGNGKEVVDGINSIDMLYIYQLMSNVQLPVSKTFD